MNSKERVLAAVIGGALLLGTFTAATRTLSSVVPDSVKVEGKVEVVVRVEISGTPSVTVSVPPLRLVVPTVRASADVTVREP